MPLEHFTRAGVLVAIDVPIGSAADALSPNEDGLLVYTSGRLPNPLRWLALAYASMGLGALVSR